MSRTHMYTLMIDDEEYAELEELAELLGMSKAAAARYAIKRQLRSQRIEELEFAKLKETTNA